MKSRVNPTSGLKQNNIIFIESTIAGDWYSYHRNIIKEQDKGLLNPNFAIKWICANDYGQEELSSHFSN